VTSARAESLLPDIDLTGAEVIGLTQDPR
jgi:hypothetical protein